MKGTASRNTTDMDSQSLQLLITTRRKSWRTIFKKESNAKAGRWGRKEKRPPPDREGCDKSIMVLLRCPSSHQALITGWSSSHIPQFSAASLLCQPFSPQLLPQTMWPLPTPPTSPPAPRGF